MRKKHLGYEPWQEINRKAIGVLPHCLNKCFCEARGKNTME